MSKNKYKPRGLSSVEKAAAKLGATVTGVARPPSPEIRELQAEPGPEKHDVTQTPNPSEHVPLEPPPLPPAPQTPRRSRSTTSAASAAKPAALPETVAEIDAEAVGGRESQGFVEIDLDRLKEIGLVGDDAERLLMTEEFRLVKRPLLLQALERGPDAIRNANVVLIASSRPGEGKTFCAVSLAMSIAAEPDLSVLLVDADVIKAGLHEVLGYEAERGLVDLLVDEDLGLSDVSLRTQFDNLSILPAGRPHELATELLASERMARLVNEISRSNPDRIIIFDSPPVLMSSIPGVLALHVGQVLFVVEADKTTEAALDNSLSLVGACKNISILLNKTQVIAGTAKFGAYYYR